MKTVITKQLEDGRLELISYTLDDIAAENLKRPVGSVEMVLDFSGEVGICTNPSASWYLIEDFYQKLFDKIINYKDFLQTRDFLDYVAAKGHELTRKARGVIK